MRKILLLAAVSFSFSTHAQKHFGVKAGVAISNHTGSSNSGAKSLTGLQASLFGRFDLSNLFTLQPSVGYYAKGNRITDLTFADQLGNDIGNGDLNFRYDYLELTVPVQYLISNKAVKIGAGVGPYMSYAFGGKVSRKNITGPAGNEPKKENLNFDYRKRFDLGLTALISAQFKTWILSLNYDQGVINVNKGNQPKTQNISGGLAVGYLFK